MQPVSSNFPEFWIKADSSASSTARENLEILESFKGTTNKPWFSSQGKIESGKDDYWRDITGLVSMVWSKTWDKNISNLSEFAKFLKDKYEFSYDLNKDNLRLSGALEGLRSLIATYGENTDNAKPIKETVEAIENLQSKLIIQQFKQQFINKIDERIITVNGGSAAGYSIMKDNLLQLVSTLYDLRVDDNTIKEILKKDLSALSNKVNQILTPARKNEIKEILASLQKEGNKDHILEKMDQQRNEILNLLRT